MNMLAFLLALLSVQSHLQLKKPRTNRELLTPILQKELAAFEREYGVHFAINESEVPLYLNGFWGMSGESTFSLFLDKYLPHLLSEFRLYPAALFHKLKIKEIICCQNLKSHGAAVDGVADPRSGAFLYFDVFSFGDGPWSDQERLLKHRATIHHELFHLIDFKINAGSKDDSAWSDLNLVKFDYAERKYYLNKSSWIFSSADAGFISDYSLVSPTEDKAEVFSAMMCNLRETEYRGKDDPVLGRKIARIKEMVAAYSPEMDERFWQRIRHLDRPRLTPPGYEDQWATEHKNLEPLSEAAPEFPTIAYFPGPSIHHSPRFVSVCACKQTVCARLGRGCAARIKQFPR